VFLVAAQALYAVNRHVNFVGHAATFELAETEVSEDHWSLRNGAEQGESSLGSYEEKGALRRAAETVGLADNEND
jgi:hypothetical protein